MRNTSSTRSLLSVACLALALPAAAAIERGSVENGVRYAMGGVGLGERAELEAQRGDYNLWVMTAARSGDYLADVEVRIVDRSNGRVALQGVMNGPWLLAAVPPGRYSVEATAPGGQTLTREVRVGHGGLRQAVLHFDVPQAMADAGGSTMAQGR